MKAGRAAVGRVAVGFIRHPADDRVAVALPGCVGRLHHAAVVVVQSGLYLARVPNALLAGAALAHLTHHVMHSVVLVLAVGPHMPPGNGAAAQAGIWI